MSQLQRIQPATGLDTEASPEYVGVQSAPVLRNLLSHKTGKLVQRGGLRESQLHTSDGTAVLGTPWVFQWLGTVRVAWTATTPGPRKSYVATINDSGTINSPHDITSLGLNLSEAWAQLGQYVYGVAPDGSAYSFRRWDGSAIFTTGGAYIHYPWQGSGASPVAITAYAERLWVLLEDGKLYYSIPGGPAADTVEAWQDPVSGLTNLIDLGERGVALAAMNTSLAIFTGDNVHLLTGTGSSNFARKRALQRKALNNISTCAAGDGVYFLAAEGLFYFDGAQERLLSAPVDRYIGQQYAYQFAPPGTVTNVGHGFLWVASRGPDPVTALYNIRTGDWTEITFDPAVLATNAMLWGDGSLAVAVDGHRIWNLKDLTAGLSATQGYDLVGTTKYPIDTRWRTKTFRLGSPINKATVHRIVIDFGWTAASDGDAWDYTIYTSPNDQPGVGTVLAAGALTADGEAGRHRTHIDLGMEAEDIWVEVSSSTVPSADTQAELYDIWVEYDVAQRSAGY